MINLKLFFPITLLAILISGCSKSQLPNVTYTNYTMNDEYTKNIVPKSNISEDEKVTFGRTKKASPEIVFITQQKRGVIQTGLTPKFDDSVDCRAIDSEFWAKDYTPKRGMLAHHKGIDIPAPKGTAVLAVADGVLIAKVLNEDNPKGIEIILRHSPKDTGLPMWTYSQYTHLLELPNIPIGANIKMGSVIGKTSNTGMTGKAAKNKNEKRLNKIRKNKQNDNSDNINTRRDALHFAIFYSTNPQYAVTRQGIVPIDGYFMDPNAFYRKNAPYDSISMKNLPENEKQIYIPYKRDDGKFFPENTKVIWPYSCSLK